MHLGAYCTAFKLLRAQILVTLGHFKRLFNVILPTMSTIKSRLGASLVVKLLRIHLPMQEIWVQSLVGELRFHMLQTNEAQVPQLERSPCAATKTKQPKTPPQK